jgi:hypothetical protein
VVGRFGRCGARAQMARASSVRLLGADASGRLIACVERRRLRSRIGLSRASSSRDRRIAVGAAMHPRLLRTVRAGRPRTRFKQAPGTCEPPRVWWRLCPKWRMERWPDLRGTLVRCVSVWWRWWWRPSPFMARSGKRSCRSRGWSACRASRYAGGFVRLRSMRVTGWGRRLLMLRRCVSCGGRIVSCGGRMRF